MKLPAPYDGNEPHIFISYAHKDSKQVLKIIEGLQRFGMRIWYDEGLEWGENWRTEIIRHLLESTYVVCFFTKNFFDSTECLKEMNLARENQKGPLIIYLEKVMPPEGIKTDYGDFHALQLEKFGSREELLNNICGSAILSPCRNEAWGHAVAPQIMNEEIEAWKTVADELDQESKSADALKWYRMAANQGDADAQYKMAVRYTYGMGVTKNLVEAARWYRMAAEQGDADAQRELGICFEEGIGVEQDLTEALRWYSLAAEKDNGEAGYRLGLCYELGKGVQQDIDEAYRWYLKAARNDDHEAQYKVAANYEAQGNLFEAVMWYHRASEQDHPEALCKMGHFYANGIAVKENINKAFGFYRRAASADNAEAQYILGDWYERGYGVGQISFWSIKWYQEAAKQGHAAAQAALKRLGHDW